MRVSIVGTGYVGLVSGVCLAHVGHDVTCIDVDQSKVDKINRGEPPIYEVGLEDLLKKLVGDKLSATTDFDRAVRNSDLSLIAVGTPFDGQEIDLQYIRQVARQIGEVLKTKDSYHTVIVKSTVVPGTTEDVVLPILEEASGKKAGTDFGVGMNPEFLKEGEAIDDFMYPDRIVLGGIDEKSIDALAELYAAFPDTDKIRTSPRTAEMIKYTANSLLATLISFSNEIGNLCTAIGGVDVTEVMEGVHLDKRFSPILDQGRVRPSSLTYIEAGAGFGGSCFPKDVKALITYGQDKAQPMSVLKSVIETNKAQPSRMVEMAKRHYPSLGGVKVAVLGLAFKPGTDDIRESASLTVIDQLQAEGAVIIAFDPIAQEETEKHLGPDAAIAYADTVAAAIDGAEVVMLMTSWPEFHDLPRMLEGRDALLIDGRRMIPKGAVPRYEGIGLS